MASTYALPASAMNHGHGHGHVHSHSISPSRPNSKSMRQDQSNGSLHTYSLSESQLDYHEHSHSRQRSLEHTEFVDQKEPPRAQPAYIEEEEVEEDPFGMSYDLPAYPSSYRPPLNTANVLPQTHHHDHTHRNPSVDPRSRFTGFLLPYVLRWPLLHTILSEKDSRRIFYFVSVNFAFMLVQACYGYLTDSLGLLSDSVHMFFDCLALGVGLFAAIASRWPPSERFPYGFGKLESLSGFGNAVFLMLISLEILMEAAERLFDGRETHRLAELFVVSTLGLLVNFIGLFCFGHHGHAHHGHDHGNHNHGPKAAHKHSHSHDHAHGHGHDHDHDHHRHDHGHDHANHTPLLMDEPKTTGHSHDGHVHTHSHSHSHDNDNMMGIYLHVLADALGSAAVIVSTIMIYFTGWNGWDPLASCIIAIAIFASAVPLLGQCAKKLLLTIPDEIEYNLREALGGVGDLRGVASHSVPRFWLGDKNTEDENEQVLGVIHISSTRGSDTDDVRARTSKFLSDRGIDVVVQVEKDGDSSCWCGGNPGKSPGRFS